MSEAVGTGVDVAVVVTDRQATLLIALIAVAINLRNNDETRAAQAAWLSQVVEKELSTEELADLALRIAKAAGDDVVGFQKFADEVLPLKVMPKED